MVLRKEKITEIRRCLDLKLEIEVILEKPLNSYKFLLNKTVQLFNSIQIVQVQLRHFTLWESHGNEAEDEFLKLECQYYPNVFFLLHRIPRKL